MYDPDEPFKRDLRRIEVRGYYRHVIVGHRVIVDEDNPSNETTIPVYKKVWVEPYTKLVK